MIHRGVRDPRSTGTIHRRFARRSSALFGAAAVALWAAVGPAVPAAAQTPYFPERHEWLTRAPAEAGFDAAALEEAMDFASASESDAPRDLALNHELTFAREPFGSRIGPTTVRGALSGIVVRGGYLVAEWGPTRSSTEAMRPSS